MKDKVSIIVPVYNVADYLNECLESLVNQKYNNIEILLIDDGSSDNSLVLCNKWAKRDSRIQVFHKKNGGLSDARNYGIDRAKGKYIAFVDSDDYVTEDYISSMYNNIIKYSVKISACGFAHLYNNGTIKEINFSNIEMMYSENEAQKYLNIIGYFNVSACNKLFLASLFEEIRFPIGKKSEDWFIMYKIIEKAKSIYYSSEIKYIYRQRSGSITKSSKANIEAIDAAQEVYDYFKDNKIVSPYALQSLIFAIIGVYNYELIRYKNLNLKNYRSKVLELKNKIIYCELSTSRKIQLFLFIYFPYLYNVLFKFFDKKRRMR